jgi:hypothetical protein
MTLEEKLRNLPDAPAHPDEDGSMLKALSFSLSA